MIKERITFAEMKICIDEVTDLCFPNGEYLPYMKDFAIWYVLMAHFTNWVKPEMSLDQKYSKTLDFTLREELFQNIQVTSIYETMENTIETKRQKEVQAEAHNTKLNKLIEEIFEKLDNPETVELLSKWGEEIGVKENEQTN